MLRPTPIETDNVETPPGQESRLTRAMKAYHLEKAKDASDLPPWLFPERACPSAKGSRSVSHMDMEGTDEHEESRYSDPALPCKSRGLRDVYAAAVTSDSLAPSVSTAAAPRVDQHKLRLRADEGVGPSKAADRLRAFRDAKRSELAPNSQVDYHAQPHRDRHQPFNGESGVKRGQLPHPSMRVMRPQRV
jgi:hypothetical protein